MNEKKYRLQTYNGKEVAPLTTFDFDGTILRIQWIMMQIHHARQCSGKPHAIRYRSIASQTHQFIWFSDIVQETAMRTKKL